MVNDCELEAGYDNDTESTWLHADTLLLIESYTELKHTFHYTSRKRKEIWNKLSHKMNKIKNS